MKQRCFNKNHPSYKNYGGRGIMICERWMVFENFLEDMGERPEGMTLDRIDNDGNYELGNCRWATHFDQQINSRNCILTKNKVKKIRCEENVSQEKIGKKFNVSKSTISKIRRNKSWVEI